MSGSQAAVRRIAAVGGGGFLLDDKSYAQERALLTWLGIPSPKVLYLGAALGDSFQARLKFMECFVALGCRPQTLAFFPFDMKADYRQIALDSDLIYVGGGNTVAMLAVWREFGFDEVLREAYQRGAMLAGISAGANCWFERYVTDSVPGGGVRKGLALIPGTFCPHLDSESWRQLLLDNEPTPSYGAGERVVMCFENEQLKRTLSFGEATLALHNRIEAPQTKCPA